MSLTIIDKSHAIDCDEVSTITKSIFLAGPCPRGDDTSWQKTWHAQAVTYLKDNGYDGHVFIPLPFTTSYEDSVKWEDHFLNLADKILFWIPRSDKLPGFTTNVEFGEWMKSSKTVLAYPEDAKKCRYLHSKATTYKVPVFQTLEGALQKCVDDLGVGSTRQGGETFVPLNIWQNPAFQSWYLSHLSAGNTLQSGKVLWEFVMPIARKVFCWAYHANMYIGSEERVKSNEFVFTRSDISVIFAWSRGKTFADTNILCIKEFRTPARTFDGFVHELPGGSSMKDNEDPLSIASHELEEETGLKIAPNRFHYGFTAQLASTLSSHCAHVFCVEITEDELQSVLDTEAGVADDTELTYVSAVTFKQVMNGTSLFDLSMSGIVARALTMEWNRGK